MVVGSRCRQLLALAASAHVLVACSAPAPPTAPEPVVSMVDGVRVVDNSAPAWRPEEAWRISDAPRVTIGADVGEPWEMFANLRPPTRLSDGRIVIADDAHELKYFDAEGNYLYTRSGHGEGPGEFTYIALPQLLPGDGLIVDNFNGPRGMHVFDAEGNYTYTIQLASHDMSYGTAMLTGTFGDGSLFARATERPLRRFRPGEIGWRMLGLFRYAPDGSQPQHLGDFRAGQRASQPLVFGATAQYATYADGFYYADGAAHEIGGYDRNGRHQLTIRWAAPTTAVTTELQQEWIGLSRANIEAFGDDPNTLERMNASVFAENLPATFYLTVDDAGNIWALRHAGLGHEQPVLLPGFTRLSPDASDWDVFASDGVWLGTVSLPPTLYPGHIGNDAVLLAGMDDGGIERVFLYELIKP